MKASIGILAAFICGMSVVACGGVDETATEAGAQPWTIERVEDGYVLTDPEGATSETDRVNLSYVDEGTEAAPSSDGEGLESVDKMRIIIVVVCDECHMDGDILHCTGCR